MKTLIRFLLIPFFSVGLHSCGESHFLKEESYRNQVAQDFERKQQVLPNGELFAIFSDSTLTLSEREALMFLYAYMPIGDITDYSGQYHLNNIRLSEQARREMPWGKIVTDELFRHFVLPVRVNNENLDESRGVFYNELKDRVKGLSMKDAILEVNHWCHEKVVYRPSDSRTSSPLASVKTAYGRCGEESTFGVAALRSVGIPARQVYTPRWAHTDDNHAWVEAWADGQWYFLGACEPEPVLNLGWFNAPASRGMLMHTKVFGRYNGPEEIMLETPNYTEINVIDNYAPTAKAVVTVTDKDGRPVSGARVDFKVYNYAEFYTVATKYTDADGRASLTAGKGDMLVWASDKKGVFGFSKLSFGKQSELVLALDKKEGDIFEMDIDIVPPVENAVLPEVTSEQRAENDRRMTQEDSIRNAYVATFPTDEQATSIISSLKEEMPSYVKESLVSFLLASRGNHDVLVRFLTEADKQGKLLKGAALLSTLSQKDLRDVSYEVLIDNLENTEDASSELYLSVVAPKGFSGAPLGNVCNTLSPRVSMEMLTPYKSFFQSVFSEVEADGFRKSPQTLVEWVNRNITIDEENNYQRIPISPIGVWRSRVADARSRDVFFVALARSLNIGANMRSMDGRVRYVEPVQDCPFGKYMDVDFNKKETAEPSGGVYSFYDGDKVIAHDDERVKYYSKFTISRIKEGRPELIDCDDENPELTNKGVLDAGYYLLVTGARLADGGVLARISSFVLPEQREQAEAGMTKVQYHLRKSGEKVAVIGNFNSESLFTPIEGVGKDSTPLAKQSLLQACGRGYFVVGILGPGQEPTNHALRDIAALKSSLEKWGRKMVLLFPNEEQCKKFSLAEFPELPSTVMYGIDTDGICQQIVENMKLAHKNSLPVFIIADTFNRVVFVSQGYTIGLGEQLMKTVNGL